MDVSSAELWSSIARSASASESFGAKARHLEALTIAIVVGDQQRVVEIHRGRAAVLPSVPLRGTTLRIAGPVEEWRRLVRGEALYAQAIHPIHGRLQLTGDAVAAAWATPALWELFRTAVRVAGEASHG
jgi:hypothetical protein